MEEGIESPVHDFIRLHTRCSAATKPLRHDLLRALDDADLRRHSSAAGRGDTAPSRALAAHSKNSTSFHAVGRSFSAALLLIRLSKFIINKCGVKKCPARQAFQCDKSVHTAN